MATIKKSTATLSPLDNIFNTKNPVSKPGTPATQPAGKKKEALNNLDDIFGSNNGGDNKPFAPAWQEPKPASAISKVIDKVGDVVKSAGSGMSGFFKPDYGLNDTQGVPTTPEIIKNPKSGTIKVDTLKSGGAYNTIPGKPNALVNTGHTNYAGEEAVAGQQRDDLVPVGLGGVNQNPKNIKLTNLKNANQVDEMEKQLISDYKAGKIGLREAQIKILTAKERMADNLDTNPHSLNNIFGGLETVIKNPVDAFKKTFGIKQTPELNISTKDLAKNMAAESAANPGADKLTQGKAPVFDKGGYDNSLQKIVAPKINPPATAKINQKVGATLFNTLSSSAVDFLNRGSNFLGSLDSRNTPPKRVGAMGELATGGFNTAFAPVSSLFEAGKAARTDNKSISAAGLLDKAGLKLPMKAYGNMTRAIDKTSLDDAAKDKLKSLASLVTFTAEPGDIVNLAESPFYLVGMLGSKTFNKILDISPVDQSTKDDLRPFVGELGGIVGMLGLGGLGIKGLEKVKETKAREYVKNSITDQAHEIINNYSDIKLDKNSTPADVQAAYRSAAAKTHPDKGGLAEDFNAVNLANQYLSGKLPIEKATVEFSKLNPSGLTKNQPIAGELTGKVEETLPKAETAPIEPIKTEPIKAEQPIISTSKEVAPVTPREPVTSKNLPQMMSGLNDIFSVAKQTVPEGTPGITPNPIPANKPVQQVQPVASKSSVKMEDLVVQKPIKNDVYLEKSGDNYLYQEQGLKRLVKAIKGTDSHISDDGAFQRASMALKQANEAFKGGQHAVAITQIGGATLTSPIRLVKAEMKGKLPQDIIANTKPVKSDKINPEQFSYNSWPSEMESQFENFKQFLTRIPNPKARDRLTNGDAETFKKVAGAYGISPQRVDNMFYSQSLTNHEVFSKFLDRFYKRNEVVDSIDKKFEDYYQKLKSGGKTDDELIKDLEKLSVEDVWGGADQISENNLDSLITKTEGEIKQYENQFKKVEDKTSPTQKTESPKTSGSKENGLTPKPKVQEDIIDKSLAEEPKLENEISADLEERANQDWEDNPKYGEKIGELFQQAEDLSKELNLEKNKDTKAVIQKKLDDLNVAMNSIHESFINKWKEVAKQEKLGASNKTLEKKPDSEISYPDKNPETGVKIYGHLKDGIAKLDSIEITPAKQKQGLGSKYVANFEKWAKDNGAKIVQIDAYKKSELFWEKKGYKMPKEYPTSNGVVQDYKPGVKALNNVFEKKATNLPESRMNPYATKREDAKFDYLNMTPDQARAELYKMFPKSDIKLIERELGSVFEKNGDIFGKDIRGIYDLGDGVISVVMNDGRVNNRVVYHEAWHHYINTYMPLLDKGNLVNSYYREHKAELDAKYKDYANVGGVRAEEALADWFADYKAGRATFTGRVKAIFDSIIRHIKKLFGELKGKDSILELFDKVVSGEAKTMKKNVIFSKDRTLVFNKKIPSIKPSELTNEQHKLLDEAAAEIAKISTKIPVPEGIQKSIPFWRDKSTISLSRESMERNIDAVAGDNAYLVKEFLTEPVKRNETSRIVFTNALRTDIENYIVKQLGIKKGSDLSALVQKFGEGEIDQKELMTKTIHWPKVIEASEYLRKVYDNILDMWNGVRENYGYEPVPKREDYFRHGEFISSIAKQFGMIMSENDLPTSISGITYIFKPGTPFSTAALKRTGVTTDYDAVAGIDNYIDAVSKSIFHTDSVQRGRALEKIIRKGSEIIEGVNINAEQRIPEIAVPNFVANLNEWTNLISGKKSQFDRSFESVLGRRVYSWMSVLTKRTGANMIAGNMASAITNFIPITQLLATTNKISAVRGLAEISKGISDPTIIDGQTSGFLIRRFNKESIGMTKVQKASAALNSMFKFVDLFTSRWTVGAKYYENLSKGMDKKSALLAADNYAAQVITDRSIGQLPNLFGIKTIKAFTQFQTEINNQYSFMVKDIPKMAGGNKLKLFSMAVQFMLYSYLFNQLYEKLIGRRPAIDPIYDALTLAGQTTDGSKVNFGKRLVFAGKDISGNLPFTGSIIGGRLPVSAGIPDFQSALNGTSSWSKELQKPLFYLVPPVAGGQIKKTYEGLKAYNQGGSYSNAGLLQYPIDKTPTNEIKTAVFGKSSTGDSQTYFGEGRSSLSKGQTKEYKRLLEFNPLQARPYYDRLIRQREKKAEAKKSK